jgi:2-polyprenyl-3-methyl-5-hydroxy-6-metoxy-1,4-benzoquinol methylase
MSSRSEPVSAPAARRVAERFARFRSPGSGRFFEALAGHFAHLEDHPVLPLHFEYAATANERGERAAEHLFALLPALGRRGVFARRPRVLDVGCAYGGFLVAFARRGARVAGIDIDPRYVRLAALNLREQGLDGDLVHGDAGEPRPEFSGRFDLVIANDVLEHVPRPAAFLANLRDWLTPSGAAWLEIPNGAWPPYVVRDGHHQLFGVTLLDHAEASEYMELKSPGGRYDTYQYLGPDECARLFHEAGLTFEVLPDAAGPAAVARVLAEVEALRAATPAGLAAVPAPLREKVRERLRNYLEGIAWARRRTDEEIRRFLLLYGAPFWTVLARRR